MENIQTGFLLMVVGMTTVFLILLLVIYLSKGLITLVNKYAPEDISVKKQLIPAGTTGNSIPDSTSAAIISAVSVLTGGKGKVIKIEKK